MREHLRTSLMGLLTAALLSSGAAEAADATWVRVGLETTHVWSVAVDPSSPSTVYAAGYVGSLNLGEVAEARLAKSANGGATWSVLDLGCKSTYFRFVTIDPHAPGTLYSGSGSIPCPLQKSTDGGRSWSAIPPPAGLGITALALDPNRASTLYVGLYQYGCEDMSCLLKSDDGGSHWSFLPVDMPPPDITSIAVAPSSSGTLYVGTGGSGAYKSADGGATWSRVGPVEGSLSVFAVAVDARAPENVFVAAGRQGLAENVFTSLDGGTTWRGSTLDGHAGTIAIDSRTTPSAVYAGTDAGVFRSRDLGGHWEAVGLGTVANVSSLILANSDPPVLYAGSWDGGVYALTLEAVSAPGTEPHAWTIPSSARAPGAHGAFYTTDLAIANPGAVDATLTIRFLGHDGDGTNGLVTTRMLAAGRAVTYADVLGSLFGIEIGYGALRVTSDAAALRMTAFTSTRSADGRGSVGQGVPAFDATRLATPGSPAVLVGLRDDGSSRTNLALASASLFPVTVELTLSGADGAVLGRSSRDLPPLGMTQVPSAVAALRGPASGDAYLVVRVTTPGGAVAAYASVTDNGTNDPRTVLP